MKRIVVIMCLLIVGIMGGIVHGVAKNISTFLFVMIFLSVPILLIVVAKNYGERLGRVLSRDELILEEDEVYIIIATNKIFGYWPDFPCIQREKVLVFLQSLEDNRLQVCYMEDVPCNFQVKIVEGKRKYVPWRSSWST